MGSSLEIESLTQLLETAFNPGNQRNPFPLITPVGRKLTNRSPGSIVLLIGRSMYTQIAAW